MWTTQAHWDIFYKHRNIKSFDNLSFKSKYLFSLEFFHDLEKIDRQDPKKEQKSKKNG